MQSLGKVLRVPAESLGEVPEGSGADTEVRLLEGSGAEGIGAESCGADIEVRFRKLEGSSVRTEVRFRKIPVAMRKLQDTEDVGDST